MTISELRLALDLSFENKADVLKRYAKLMPNKKYLFVDSSDGSCHLFDGDGNEDDIAKLDYIEDALFYNDKSLKLIRIPDSVTRIGSSAFCGCNGLTSVTIGNSVTSIGKWAFARCSGFTSVIIPNSVTSIENYVFFDCSGLMSVTIGKGIMSIGHKAFFGYTNLKELIFKGKPINEVKAIEDYHWWGIEDESIIKCES